MPTTVFTTALGSNINGIQGFSLRTFATVTAGGLGQVRVTFKAGPGGVTVDHCSIAVIGGATAPNVAATPTELLFSGGSGFTIGANASITSDWLTFSFAISDTLGVVLDLNAAGGGDVAETTTGGGSGVLTPFYKGATASYNQATVSGFSGGTAGTDFGVLLIETQAGGAVAATYGNMAMMGVG